MSAPVDERPAEGQQLLGGGEVPAAPIYVEQLRVDGSVQLAVDVGGKHADEGTLKLSCPAIETDGFFQKGDIIRGEFVAVVREVQSKDKVDKQSRVVISCAQKHGAEVVDLKVTSTESPD